MTPSPPAIDPAELDAQITEIVRAEHGRVVASLIRRLGDIDLAEDAAAEALVTALERWPVDGLPPNPGAWLTTTAANKAIDRIRRESTRDSRHAQAVMINEAGHDYDIDGVSSVVDDRLRLMFTCCHPALAPEAQIALKERSSESGIATLTRLACLPPFPESQDAAGGL